MKDNELKVGFTKVELKFRGDRGEKEGVITFISDKDPFGYNYWVRFEQQNMTYAVKREDFDVVY